MHRPDPMRALSRVGALATLALGPLGLLLAWWRGFEASWPAALIGLAPPLLAWWRRRPRPGAAATAAAPPPGAPPPAARAGAPPAAAAATWRGPARVGRREFANAVFHVVTAFERRLASSLAAIAGGLAAPARDLHTGDAQEYLLFLVGVAVLALLLPLLR